MGAKKTGGGGGSWIVYDSPKPPPVDDNYAYWADPPPEISERCAWWVRQIELGWRPNRRLSRECLDCSAEWYGIYNWEFVNVICPALGNGRLGDYKEPPTLEEQILAHQIVHGPQTEQEAFEDWVKGELEKALTLEINMQILYGEGY